MSTNTSSNAGPCPQWCATDHASDPLEAFHDSETALIPAIAKEGRETMAGDLGVVLSRQGTEDQTWLTILSPEGGQAVTLAIESADKIAAAILHAQRTCLDGRE